MKQSQLKQIIKEEIQKILSEDLDISAEVSQYVKNNPFDEKNKYHGEYEVKSFIEDKMGRPLTPQEKSKITRIFNKFRSEYNIKDYTEKMDKEDAEERERYRNNLLPLTTDNGRGRPDPTYYEYTNTYYNRDHEGNVTSISHMDSKSGYTDYQLKSKWVDTPVDKATLDRYWSENRLRYIGWFNQEEK
jgi:hypothetical protein